jgi:hypothetical protein
VEEGYCIGVELRTGGRVRLARGSFEELITGAWRSATVRFALGCGGIGGSHAASSRRSSQVHVETRGGSFHAWIEMFGFGHFCIWGFVIEQASLHLGIWDS